MCGAGAWQWRNLGLRRLRCAGGGGGGAQYLGGEIFLTYRFSR